MQSENLLIFPTLVKKITNFLTVNECNIIASNLNLFNFKSHSALTGNSSSNHDGTQAVYVLNIIDKYFPINQRVFDIINDYAEQLGTDKLGIDNSWINIQGPGSELKPHTHPTSVVSGALYIKIDINSSGIQFINPNPYLDMVDMVTTSYSSKNMIIKPSAGDLLLFPSWLKHSSDSTNMSEQRIVLSFNTGYIKNNLPR